MISNRIMRYCSAIAILPAVLVFTGCGSPSAEDALAVVNDSNIKRLANLYVRYQADHAWKGPSNEEDFREYIENGVPDFVKERIGFTSTEAVFLSQRDDQPFKIRWEIVGSSRGCTEPAIFESTGRSGKRMVGFLNMVQREVEEQEYNDLWEGKYEPPPQS